MKNILIPDDFFQNATPGKTYDSISIIQYSSFKESSKVRVTLNQNVFAFLREGSKTVSYFDKCEQVHSAKFALLSAGNCLMSEKRAAENGEYKSTMFLFDNTVLASFFLKYPHLLSANVKDANQDIPFIIFRKDDFINNFITSLDLISASGQEISAEMKRLKFEELMLYLCGLYPEHIVNFRTSAREAREDYELRKAVESNLENNITVEELAFLCNTSVSTFKRRFVKIYGSSPNKWMIQKRMEMAANLLKHGNEKPSDIYYKVGYENLSSFIQSFKQVYGVTPKEYQSQSLNV